MADRQQLQAESDAIAVIVKALEPLDKSSAERVIQFVQDYLIGESLT